MSIVMATGGSEEAEARHIQAIFSSKEERLQVGESPFSLPASATRRDLNNLITHILYEGENGDEGGQRKRYDFLVQGELLQGTLETHITKRKIPTEGVISIEVIEQTPPPSLSVECDHSDWVSSVHCSQKFILTGCYDNSVKIWNYSGELECTAVGHTAPVKSVSWVTPALSSSVAGCVFVSGSQDQNIHLWRIPSHCSQAVLLHTCKGHSRSVEDVAVSPSTSKFCSVSWDKLLKIWSAIPDESGVDEVEEEEQITKRAKMVSLQRATTRTPLLTLQAHTQPASTVLWSLEEEIISAGLDHSIRLWDVPSGVNKSTVTGSKAFHCIDQSLISQLVVSANSDRIVRIWDTRMGASSMVQAGLSSHQGWVVSVHWSPHSSNLMLSGAYDNTVRVWDIRSTKTPLFTITAHEGKVLCVDWSLAEVIASGGTDSKLRTFSFSHSTPNSNITDEN